MYEAQITAQTNGKITQNLLIEVTPTKVICHPDPNRKRKSLKGTYEFRISEISSVSFQKNAPNKNLIAPKGEWRHQLILANQTGQAHLGGAYHRSSFYFRSVRDGESVRDEIANAQSKLEAKLVNPSPSASIADEIGKLAQLRDEGVITQKEFEQGKGRFLGLTTDAQKTTTNQLRQLHSLYKDGILSESEFNMKKWDILSKN